MALVTVFVGPVFINVITHSKEFEDLEKKTQCFQIFQQSSKCTNYEVLNLLEQISIEEINNNFENNNNR